MVEFMNNLRFQFQLKRELYIETICEVARGEETEAEHILVHVGESESEAQKRKMGFILEFNSHM